jgi:hypothetical protein
MSFFSSCDQGEDAAADLVVSRGMPMEEAMHRGWETQGPVQRLRGNVVKLRGSTGTRGRMRLVGSQPLPSDLSTVGPDPSGAARFESFRRCREELGVHRREASTRRGCRPR